MRVREIERNKKYQIEIVLGYNGGAKIRLYETFIVKKVKLNLENMSLKPCLEMNQLFQKNNLTVKDLSIKYLKY